MGKLGLMLEGNSLLALQFRKFFWGTQVAAAGGILNLIFFGDNLAVSSNILFFRLDLIALLIGVIVSIPLFGLLNQGKYQQAITTYLWLWTIIMAFNTWFEGGLYSPLLLSFPMIFVFAALFTELFTFLSICTFLSIIVVFMGFNHIHSWLLPPPGMLIEGVPRVISALVLTTLSGYVCWLFGRLFYDSFENLHKENQRVLDSQDVIKRLANCDSLTNLLNRNGAKACYQQLLSRINFNQNQLVAYFIDLDDFKNINDLFDHQAGDHLLVTMSRRMEALLNKNDFACRFGGDEFVLVLCTKLDFDEKAFAKAIMKSLAKPHSILGTESEVTASVGIAIVDDAGTSFDSACKKADMAMYKAKQSGKDNCHLYSDTLDREYMRNLHILSSLKTAVSSNLLDLHFQPKIHLKSNKVEGVEALLRWSRENDDNIGPEEFIPIIESTELIHSVGKWVINEACISCKKWQSAGQSLKVAVNVSALQLTQPNFYQTVVDALEESGLSPTLLEIEITEHSLIKEAPLVKKQLEALKALGVGLAIDDFGTGYSNMGYLTRLQIDVLKLDRSFVSRVTESGEHWVIVIAIIKMAQVLGMKVVAEGIETEIERDVLKGLNCDYGQGFLWSKAVPGTELLKVINQI